MKIRSKKLFLHANFYSSILYLISAVLFILSLNGLSHPETARRGNLFGMIGMGIAIFTTLAIIPFNSLTYLIIFAGIAAFLIYRLIYIY